METISIGREKAIELAETKWWEGKSAREIARHQLFTAELCCPFGVFHKAVEESLGRPVFTHEFGANWEGLCREFLGEGDPPTLQEIIGMLGDKTVVVVVDPN